MSKISPARFSLDRRIPLALVLTLFMQAGGAIWWAAGREAADQAQNRRLQQLEGRAETDIILSKDIVQRLARLEARAEEQSTSLRRIENILVRGRP